MVISPSTIFHWIKDIEPLLIRASKEVEKGGILGKGYAVLLLIVLAVLSIAGCFIVLFVGSRLPKPWNIVGMIFAAVIIIGFVRAAVPIIKRK